MALCACLLMEAGGWENMIVGTEVLCYHNLFTKNIPHISILLAFFYKIFLKHNIFL
jgi:hypothetical protein